MDKIWYGTQQEYDKLNDTFREVQKSKPRYYWHGDLNNQGEWEEWTTRRKMTNTRKGLQKEYDIWRKSRKRYDTIYFVRG